MLLGLVITFGYLAFIWLVFFKFKWLKFSMAWGVVSTLFGVHLLLIFLVGVRFTAPYSTAAHVVQHTIQLTPRLNEPTLVTAVLVEPNMPVKKGQPLFQFDRRLYEYKVDAAKAQLAAAEQNVLELKAAVDAAAAAVDEARAKRETLQAALVAANAAVSEAKAKQVTLKSALDAAIATLTEAQASQLFSQESLKIAEKVKEDNANAISKLRYDQTNSDLNKVNAAVQVAQANVDQARSAYGPEAEAAINVAVANEAQVRAAGTEAEAAIAIAVANLNKARLAYESQINGENTAVAIYKIRIGRGNVLSGKHDHGGSRGWLHH